VRSILRRHLDPRPATAAAPACPRHLASDPGRRAQRQPGPGQTTARPPVEIAIYPDAVARRAPSGHTAPTTAPRPDALADAPGEIPHISWQAITASARRLATQTETPQVTACRCLRSRWHRTDLRTTDITRLFIALLPSRCFALPGTFRVVTQQVRLTRGAACSQWWAPAPGHHHY